MAENYEVLKIAGLRLKLDGESEFEKGLRDAQHEVKMFGTEARRSTEKIQSGSGSLVDYKNKVSALEKQLKAKSDRLVVLNDVLEETKKQHGENSKESQRLAERLESERLAYDKMENAVNRAQVEMEKYKSSTKGMREELARTNPELVAFQEALETKGQAWQESGAKIKKAGDAVADVGKKMTTRVTLPLAAAAGAAVKSFTDFETAFTGVKKTVDGTPEQLDKVKESILDMSTEIPHSAVAIANVAEVAGQLGIETPNIIEFTRTILDLSAATNIVGEEGAQQIAQFANVTGMAADDYRRFGSAITELGNNSATTEKDILNMATKIAGAGNIVGLTEPDILGLSSALSSVGINAEAGGTSMSTFLLDIQKKVEQGGEELESLAEVAGMTAEDFKTYFQKDAAGALDALIGGMQETHAEGGSMVKLLDDLGIKNTRMRTTLLNLAGAEKSVGEYIAMSNDAWDENIALTREANAAYETTESALQLAKNEINRVAIEIGETLAPYVKDAAEWLGDLVAGFSDLPEGVQATILKLALFVGALGPILTVGGNVLSLFGSIKGVAGKILEKAGAPAIGEFLSKFIAAEGPLGGVAGNLGTMAANLGIIGAVGLVAWEGFKWMTQPSPEMDKKLKQIERTYETSVAHADSILSGFEANEEAARVYIERINELEQKEGLSNIEKQEMIELVKELNKLFPSLGLEVDEYTGKLSSSTEAVESFIAAEKERVLQEALREKWVASIKAEADAYTELQDARDKAEKAEEDWNNATWDSAFKIGPMNKAFQDAAAANEDYEKYQKKRIEFEEMYVQMLADTAEATVKVSEADTARTATMTENTAELEAETQRRSEMLQQSASSVGLLVNDINLGAGELASQAMSIMSEFAEDMGIETDSLLKSFESHYGEIESLSLQHFSNMGGISDAGIEVQELSAAEIKANLEQQVVDYAAWQTEIAAIAERVPPAVAQELEKLGPTARNYIAELNNMSDVELNSHVSVWEDKLSLARQTAVNELGALPEDVLNVLYAMGYAIDENGQIVENAAGTMAQNAVDTAASKASSAYSVGLNLASGMASGMTSDNAYGYVWSAATNLVSTVMQAIKVKAGIRSPSRLMRDEVGGPLTQGIAEGILAKKDEAIDATTGLIDGIADAAKRDIDSPFLNIAGDQTMELLSERQANALIKANEQAEELGYEYGKRYQLGVNRAITGAVQATTTAQQITAKIVGGNSDPVPNTNPTTFVIENLHVRDDSDVRRIAEELHRLERRQLAGVGYAH